MEREFDSEIKSELSVVEDDVPRNKKKLSRSVSNYSDQRAAFDGFTPGLAIRIFVILGLMIAAIVKILMDGKV